ncbi:MAG TPA: hypothetical protein PK951_02365 [Chitinophagaceae bacterium]|nr:hypothetical protein [Chitinophagaceae bacterium]HUM66977.1 hypothetical protein [Chitinophagaceae bacterium]
MNTRKTIRKVLFVAMWMVIGGGMLVLLIAAMGKQKSNICNDVVITIKGVADDKCFLSKSDITQLLRTAVKGNIKGQPKSDFNLLEMEALLEQNIWVKDAQLYFDSKDVLHVTVSEREPVARIFTNRGKSFYIDDEEKGIPLSENLSTKVPVFTGVPDKEDRRKRDSLLLRDIKETAKFISNHPFWQSQVAQVDLVRPHSEGDYEFEMIPVVGNHVVRLGSGADIDRKFNRLFVFYKEILSRTGFEKYKTIDVRFAGQVIGAKDGKSK